MGWLNRARKHKLLETQVICGVFICVIDRMIYSSVREIVGLVGRASG